MSWSEIGKLSRNVDIIVHMLADKRNGCVHDTLLEWFEEYQTTTMNLRLLGIDQVDSVRPLYFLAWAVRSRGFLVCHDGFGTHQIFAANRPHKFQSQGSVSLSRPLPLKYGEVTLGIFSLGQGS